MRLISLRHAALSIVVTIGAACAAEETCQRADDLFPDGALELDRLDAVSTYTPQGAEFPWFIVPTGDVNGDGVADLLISTTGMKDAREYVVFGGPQLGSGSFVDAVMDGAGFTIDDVPPNAAAQASRAGIGDVNGDGLADLALGGARNELMDEGRGFIVFGRASPAPAHLATLVEEGGGIVITGNSSPGEIGRVMAGTGDADGDAVRDLLILRSTGELIEGAMGDDMYLPREYGLWLIRGGGPRTVALGPGGGSRLVLRSGEGDGSYPLVVGIGDLDGDGRTDFAIGDVEAAGTRGRVYLFSAAALDMPTPPTPAAAVVAGLAAVLEGAREGDELGFALADIGDLNGDGLVDVAVGASGASGERGQIFVVYGSPTVWTTRRASLEQGAGGFIVTGDRTFDHLKYVGGGDLDADGTRDLLVGSGHGGYAHILRGSRGWDDRAIVPGAPEDITIAGSRSCDLNGSVIVALGDVTGDKIDDFAMLANSFVFGTVDPLDARVSIIHGRAAW